MTIKSILLLIVPLAVGCSNKVDSENIPTAELHASISVVAKDSATTVDAWLRSETGIFGDTVVLSGGDRLTGTDGSDLDLSRSYSVEDTGSHTTTVNDILLAAEIRNWHTVYPVQ